MRLESLLQSLFDNLAHPSPRLILPVHTEPAVGFGQASIFQYAFPKLGDALAGLGRSGESARRPSIRWSGKLVQCVLSLAAGSFRGGQIRAVGLVTRHQIR